MYVTPGKCHDRPRPRWQGIFIGSYTKLNKSRFCELIFFIQNVVYIIIYKCSLTTTKY
jgi:hypothetical protein